MPPIPAGSTLFEFSHALFSAPEARFVLGSDGRPCMGMKLGALDALVPLSSLVKEFNIEGTPDAVLLQTVIAGLKYVKVIRPGDSIPRELLDGTASWRVDDEHIEIAEGRVTLQLNGWLNGQERLVVDPIEILQLVEDPAVVARVKAGYSKVAERLGLTSEKEVRARLDKLTRELVYIEALRSSFAAIQQLQGKVASTITYIRESRDALHARLMSWDDIIKRWQSINLEISVANEGMIKDLYRFLAQNYLTTKSW